MRLSIMKFDFLRIKQLKPIAIEDALSSKLNQEVSPEMKYGFSKKYNIFMTLCHLWYAISFVYFWSELHLACSI